MSKINIYYLCMFTLLLVCVSGLDDLEKVKKNKMMNAMKSVSSSKIIDSNNDGEDLLVKKRSNVEEDRELGEGTGSEEESPGSTSSTAEGTTTPEVTTTVSSGEGEGENGSEEASESTASTPAATTTAADTGSTEATTTGETSSTSETTTGPSETGSTVEGTTGETSATTETKETSADTGSTTAAPETTTVIDVTTTPDDEGEGSGETDEPTTAPSGTETTTLPPLECSYQYSTYKFIKGSEKEKTLYPVAYDYYGAPITYEKKNCDNVNIKLLSDGNITLTPKDIDENINSITCTIECKVGNQSKETKITINFVVYEPTGINPFASRVPVMVRLSTAFNVTLGLKYPAITGIEEDELKENRKDVTLNFNDTTPNSYNVNQDDKGTPVDPLTKNSTFKWNNLHINYTGTDRDGGMHDVTVNIKDTLYGINEDYTITVNHNDSCSFNFSFDDEGLCCDGRRHKNELCTKIQGAFAFKTRPGVNVNFQKFYESFNQSMYTLLQKSPYWYEDKTDGNDKNNYYIRFILAYIKDSRYPYYPTEQPEPENRRLLEDGINWGNIFENKDIDPIQFGNALMTIVAPSDNEANPEEIVIPAELIGTDIGNILQNEVINKEIVKQAVKEITTVAKESGVTKDPDNYFVPKTQIGDEVDHSPKDDKPWAEEYWWAILLICIGAVLIIGIVVAVLVISLSSSGSSKTNKKDLEKSEKIMETVIPIDKIKQENEISDDDIYKPFSYEVIMEGYLLKEGRDRVVGKWQRRYCVLYFEPSVLRIYDSMVPSYYGKVYIDEKQSIPLECYNGIEYKEGSNEFTLILKVRDSTIKAFEVGDKERKIQMKVEGENGVETAKRWVECFRDFKSQKPKSGDAWTRPLIIDQNNGKISTTTNKAVEKKNEEIVLKAQQRRQAATTQK